jgi:hypothetical protein
LGQGWSAQEGVDLVFGEQTRPVCVGVSGPDDVPFGVEADVGGDGGDDDVRRIEELLGHVIGRLAEDR